MGTLTEGKSRSRSASRTRKTRSGPKTPDKKTSGIGEWIWRRPILSETDLSALVSHEYRGVPVSPFEFYCMIPFWKAILDFVPRWMAPNLITLIGTIPLMCWYGYMATMNVDPQQVPYAPPSVWLWAFALEFFYQTMDGIDGLQARRVGAGSALGCLFDHGCDCLANIAHVEIVQMLFAPVAWDRSYGGQMFLMTSFFVCQWKHNMTGLHQHNIGWIGVSDILFLVTMACLGRWYIGGEVWSALMGSESYLEGWSIKDATLLGWGIFNTLICVVEIPKTLYQSCNSVSKAAKGASQLIPLFVLNVVMLTFPLTLWTTAPAPRILQLLYAIQAVYLTLQQIICATLGTCLSLKQVSVPMVIIASLLCNFTFKDDMENQVKVLWVCLGLSVIQTSSWVTSVIIQIRNRLGIRVFHIKAKSA